MSAYAAAHAEIAHERVEDEVVVINLRTGAYFSLVGTAADSWELLLTGAPLEAVAGALAQRYGVDAANVRTDLDAFASSLVQEDLLAASEPSSDEPSAAERAAAGRTYHPPMLEKYDDMEELLLLDPIHEVDESGWPVVAAEPVDG